VIRVSPAYVVWLLATTACGAGALPGPSYVAQPTSALVAVPYPPPPARVESVPPRPRSTAAWIDGEWSWRRRRWLWVSGRWVEPPRGARYAPWTLVRAADGTLYEAPGAWRDARGGEVAPPAPLAQASVSDAAVVDANGEWRAAGRTLRPPGAPVREASR